MEWEGGGAVRTGEDLKSHRCRCQRQRLQLRMETQVQVPEKERAKQHQRAILCDHGLAVVVAAADAFAELH